jgi:hypothetical protein
MLLGLSERYCVVNGCSNGVRSYEGRFVMQRGYKDGVVALVRVLIAGTFGASKKTVRHWQG